MKSAESMDRFAVAQAKRLLKRLAFQVRHATRRPNEEAIHDLRVSIRRFSECVREFRQFFPRRQTRKILRRLEKVMDLAAEMRNRDVAIKLIGADSNLTADLIEQREEAKQKLSRSLVQWKRRDFSRKWRPG